MKQIVLGGCLLALSACSDMTNKEASAKLEVCLGIDTSWCEDTVYPTQCRIEVIDVCQEVYAMPWYMHRTENGIREEIRRNEM